MAKAAKKGGKKTSVMDKLQKQANKKADKVRKKLSVKRVA